MKQILYSLCALLACVVCSCSDSEPDSPFAETPSLRDGIYKGQQLNITLNGKNWGENPEAIVKSKVLPYDAPEIKDGVIVANPDYSMRICINGVPDKGKEIVLETVLKDMRSFSGSTTIDEVEFIFIGEFGGAPLDFHNDMDLTIAFEK